MSILESAIPLDRRIDAVPNVIPKISYLMWLFEEESRVGDILAHAVQWVDEIVVLLKPSKDRTREICESFGEKVRVIDIPFTLQGQDDFVGAIRHTKNDWVWVGTASEIPTRALVRECLQQIAKQPDLDLLLVPRKIYSFGKFSEKSPWNICHYPFLFHKDRVNLTNTIHRNVEGARNGRTLLIDYKEDQCVHHFTHTTASSYIGAMSQYFESERLRPDPKEAIDECLKFLSRPDNLNELVGTHQFGVECAWRIYWLGTALHMWEKERGLDAKEIYRKERLEILASEWNRGESSFQAFDPVNLDALKQSFEVWKPGSPVASEDTLLAALKSRPISNRIETLYQVGAHRFQEKELLLETFPNLKRIVLFEPVPEMYEFLRNQERHDSRVTILPYAISSKNGKSTFHLSSNDAASSSLLQFGTHSEMFPHVTEVNQLIVETRRLEEAIREHSLIPPDMLFLDVQGSEYDILSSLSSDLLNGIKLIYTEASKEEVYLGSRSLDEVINAVSPQFVFLGYAPLCDHALTHGNALLANKDFVCLMEPPPIPTPIAPENLDSAEQVESAQTAETLRPGAESLAAIRIERAVIDPDTIQKLWWSRTSRKIIPGKIRRSARRRIDSLRTILRKQSEKPQGLFSKSFLKRVIHQLAIVKTGLKNPTTESKLPTDP